MLNVDQIKFLSKVANIKVKMVGDIPISVKRISDREIKYPYELFKQNMGLDDIRLHWLLGHNNIIAGGSVLNWVWGEDTHEDIDFFFRGEEYAENFKLFIQNIGFVSSRISDYAETFFNREGKLIVQVVGGINSTKDFRAYGPPSMILENFDMHVCKFAVDCDYLYTTARAIQDLLKLTIDTTGYEKIHFLPRCLKYIKKGFYPSPRVLGALRYEQNKQPAYTPKQGRAMYDKGWP